MPPSQHSRFVATQKSSWEVQYNHYLGSDYDTVIAFARRISYIDPSRVPVDAPCYAIREDLYACNILADLPEVLRCVYTRDRGAKSGRMPEVCHLWNIHYALHGLLSQTFWASLQETEGATNARNSVCIPIKLTRAEWSTLGSFFCQVWMYCKHHVDSLAQFRVAQGHRTASQKIFNQARLREAGLLHYKKRLDAELTIIEGKLAELRGNSESNATKALSPPTWRSENHANVARPVSYLCLMSTACQFDSFVVTYSTNIVAVSTTNTSRRRNEY